MSSVNIMSHDGKRVYVWRLRIVDTPWFGIYLHKFNEPDSQPVHNHPFNFVSFILRGGYVEDVRLGKHYVSIARERHQWRWHTTTTPMLHRVMRLTRTPTWTLVLRGRRLKRWEFFVDGKLIDFEEFLNAAK